MRRLTSVILMIALAITAVGCSSKNINEDAEAFLEETDGMETTEVASEIEDSAVEQDAETEIIEEPPKLVIGVPSGLGALSALALLEESNNENVEFEIIEEISTLISESADEKYNVLLLPTHLSAALYNKNESFKLIGTTVWSTSSIVSKSDVQTWSDLKGASITVMGENQPSDAILRYILEYNGLEPGVDLEINYITDAKALQSGLVKGQTRAAVLSEPQLSTVLSRNEDTSVVYDLSEEWSMLTENGYGIPQVSVLISADIVDKHPALTELIIMRLMENSTWIAEDGKRVADYAESINIGVNKNLIRKQLETLDLKFVPVGENKEMYDLYYDTLHAFSKRLVGGKVPSDDFYFIPPKRP